MCHILHSLYLNVFEYVIDDILSTNSQFRFPFKVLRCRSNLSLKPIHWIYLLVLQDVASNRIKVLPDSNLSQSQFQNEMEFLKPLKQCGTAVGRASNRMKNDVSIDLPNSSHTCCFNARLLPCPRC